LVGFFGWFVEYLNVGHKICMLNEKMMMMMRNLKIEEKH
jgi:hypothetical protein